MRRLRVPRLSKACRRAIILAPLSMASAHASDAPGWADTLAMIFARVDAPGLDNTHLPERLKGAIILTKAKCRTGRLPDVSSAAPVTSAIIAYGDDAACDKPTPVALMEFGVEANDSTPITRIRSVLGRQLGKPCFDGVLPYDPRRRAPARSEAGWRTEGYVITLVRESGSPAAASLAAFATGLRPGPGVAVGYMALRTEYLGNLPASCR